MRHGNAVEDRARRDQAMADLEEAAKDMRQRDLAGDHAGAAEAWLRVLVGVAALRRIGGWVQ